MQVEAFPGCCGAGVVLALDNEYARMRILPGANQVLPENDYGQVFKDLKTLVKSSKKDWLWGLLTATTNKNQVKVEELLVKLGFRQLHSFLNPKHPGSKVNLWGLDLYSLDLTEFEKLEL